MNPSSTPPLEPPEIHFLSGALGWIGLGNLAEAKNELARIGHEYDNHPDVLELRWIISTHENLWPDALDISRAQLQYAPERSSGWLNQAYALRRIPGGGVKLAWTALLPAFDKFPKEPIICYNLSCYACQLKQLDAARVWLKRAFFLGGKKEWKRMALADPDLEPLWTEIPDL